MGTLFIQFFASLDPQRKVFGEVLIYVYDNHSTLGKWHGGLDISTYVVCITDFVLFRIYSNRLFFEKCMF